MNQVRRHQLVVSRPAAGLGSPPLGGGRGWGPARGGGAASISRGRRRASNVLLAVGYPVAAAAGAKLVPMFTERRLRRFVVFQAGTAAVVAGLALRRRRIPTLLNAGALAATSAAWWAFGTCRRPGSAG